VVVVDTDVLIDTIQGGLEPAATRVAELVRSGALALSSVTLYELLQGSRTEVAVLEQVHPLAAGAEIFDLTQDAAEMAASVNRYLARRGEQIGDPDTLMAGTCLDAGLPILTRNARHFGRVPGLEVLGLE
jgi:tRNA(fMet)-specific endonuclease VapC